MPVVSTSLSLKKPCPRSHPETGVSQKRKRQSTADSEISSADMLSRDEDELFLLSLLPSLKRLTIKKRMEVRMKFQQVLYAAEFEDWRTKCTKPCVDSNVTLSLKTILSQLVNIVFVNIYFWINPTIELLLFWLESLHLMEIMKPLFLICWLIIHVKWNQNATQNDVWPTMTTH